MLLLTALLLSGLVAARLLQGPRPADADFEAAVLALGEEEDWRVENALRRRYDPPPVTLGFRAGRSA